jgi:hypothetical protein
MKTKVIPTTQPAPGVPLQVVGRISVPPTVLTHRFFLEAWANAQLAGQHEEEGERVVGTENSKAVELYGWGANVGQHVDNTGFMYVWPLFLEWSVLHARHQHAFIVQPLRVGEVVRLWDWAVHWTEDRAPAVAAFIGSFDEPCDELAMQLLQRGVDALAAGSYYDAPRVSDGYRVLMDDEALATRDYVDAEPILAADAKPRRMNIIPCGQCDRPAVRLDHHWPHLWDNNRCRMHLKAEAPEQQPRLAEAA